MSEEFVFSAQDRLSVFCEYMEVKAEQLGLSNNTMFHDPCGIDNMSAPMDMVRCLIRGYECDLLRPVWGTAAYTAKIGGKAAREMPLTSTVLAAEDSHILTDAYEVVGGKTGTLTKYGAFNLSCIVRIPDSDDLLACTVMYAEQKNGEPRNRFLAAKQAIDAAVTKYRDRAADVTKADVCADGVVVCLVPPRCAADEYHAQLDVLYQKNPTKQLRPASMTKMLTAVIVSEYLTDPDEIVRVEQDVIDAIPPYFYDNDLKAGDELTVRDLLHAMMLPSCNAAAYVFGVVIGGRILADLM